MAGPRDVALGWVASPYAALLLILAIAFGFYAQTLGFWFFYDDFWFLRASQSQPVGSYVLEAFDFRSDGPVPAFLYRPLFVVSFYGFFQVFGLHASAYHIAGVGFHLVNIALVWHIARKITKRDAIAHLAALIFALHPAYAVAVAFVSNNIVVYSTFAYLSSLLLFLRYLDGGPRRALYYWGSFIGFMAALLLHPETAQLTALLGLAFLVFGGRGLAELRSVSAWAPLLPFFAIGVGFLITQALAREAASFQSNNFQIGTHMISNYVHYVAFAVDPFRASASGNFPFDADLISGKSWRTLLPAMSAAFAAALLVKSREHRTVALFGLAWCALAILPLSTWSAGAVARKLYVVGPAFGLVAAMFFVLVWDHLASRVPARIGLLAPLLTLVIIAPMGLRVHQMTEAFDDRSTVYRNLIGEARRSEPTLPAGTRLFLVGVPMGMTPARNIDNAGLVSAFKLYYGDIEVRPVALEAQLPFIPDPPRPDDVIIRYRCPPICQSNNNVGETYDLGD